MSDDKAENWGCLIVAVLIGAGFALAIAVDPVIQIIHAVQGR